MKKLLVLLMAVMGLGMVSSAWAKAKMADTSATVEMGSGVFFSAYSAMDLASLGDMGKAVKAFDDVAKNNFGDQTHFNNDGLGILVGGQLGLQLDKNNSLSVGIENTWTSQMGTTIYAGTDAHYFQLMDPTLLGVALNYGLDLLNEGGNHTRLTLGAGFYHASLHYASNLESDTLYVGDFGSDNIGGTLGLSEELGLGGGFSFLVDARFRVADFGQLESNNLTFGGTATSGTYRLVSSSDTQFYEINPKATSYTPPSGYHWTDLDYTGFTGNLGFKLAL
ncbi:MAG TPA: hypothetical protein VHE12_11185 [bacterium]|nr:hypothetical protein [bacterium]